MPKATLRQISKNPALHLIKGHHVTNTWPARNEEEFNNLERALLEWGMHDVVICDIGPGGIAKGYEKFMPRGSKRKMGLFRRGIKKFTGALETRARNNSDKDLITFEPYELYSQLYERVRIRKMIVLDKYQRVVSAVQRLKLPRTTAVQVNLEDPSFILPEADVYVAQYVFNLCNEGTADKIFRAIPDEKVLVTSNPHPKDDVPYIIPEFTQLHPSIYYKGERPDKIRGWGKRGPDLNYGEIEPIAKGLVKPVNQNQPDVL